MKSPGLPEDSSANASFPRIRLHESTGHLTVPSARFGWGDTSTDAYRPATDVSKRIPAGRNTERTWRTGTGLSSSWWCVLPDLGYGP